MFTLPKTATDDDLLEGVRKWFTILANGACSDAQEFLDARDSPDAMSTAHFIERVAELTDGGRVSTPPPIANLPDDFEVDDLPLDGPLEIVYRWIPGPSTTERYPGFVADILHAIPVDGEWSNLDASFYVRLRNDFWSLQLRDIVMLDP